MPEQKPVAGQTVIYVDHKGNVHDAVIQHVWTDQCVNLRVDDGTEPTSVMHSEYFPSASNGETTHFLSGHYWAFKPKKQVTAKVGRIVHFVLKDARGELHHRPAIIVRNWYEDGSGDDPDFVQLQVFTDGSNDGPFAASGLVWATSVHHDETEKKEYTWHWPERE